VSPQLPLCDRYKYSSLYISGISVTDTPCFFNGEANSPYLLCASLSSVSGGNCGVIETNDLVGEGDERYCDNALSVFDFSYDFQWMEDDDGG
jgi:hypothetical protein